MKKQVFVSIIVPTYNREKQISLCLDALLNLEYPKTKYEIIIINDGSTDNTLKILKRYSSHENLRICSQSNAGPAKARNKGIKIAKGEIIIFIDDDVIANKDLIKLHLSHYSNASIGGVGGHIFPKRLSWADKYYTARYLDELYKKIIISDSESGMGLATANCSYRSNILKKLKGFNENFPLAAGEDIELSKRVMQLGYHLIKDPKIVAEHLRSESFNSTIRLKFKRMSSVAVEERLGTKAKNTGYPYNPVRVLNQWKNFVRLKRDILKEKIELMDFPKFIYLTLALFIASVVGKRYFNKKLK